MENTNDLTEGDISQQMWSLAWPMMLSFFFHTLYNIVDAYWVGKLSADAIAAVSISQIALFIMMSVGFGVTVGSGVIMAMELGSKNKDGAERVLGQSLVLMVLLSVAFLVPALIFKDQLLTLSGASGSIFEPAKEYFSVTAAGAPLFFVLIAIMFAFNSQGDTFTLTKLFALSILINLVLDPVLIFGAGPFPELGISGAAYATLFSQFVFILVALKSLSSPKRAVRFRVKNLSLHLKSVKQVMRIGFPAALTQVLNPIGLAALTFITSKAFFEPGAIAFSLAFRIEFFAYLPAVGYGFAAMAMMGQSIGAHNLERSIEVFKKAILWGSGIALGMGLITALFASQIVGIFTTDTLVVEHSVSYFRSVSFTYVFLAAMMIEANAFQAIGRSWPGFWITILRLFIVIIPSALFFVYVFDFGISGIWVAMMLGNVISALIGYVWISQSLKNFQFEQVDEVIQQA